MIDADALDDVAGRSRSVAQPVIANGLIKNDQRTIRRSLVGLKSILNH